jgi:hypothetical protein
MSDQEAQKLSAEWNDLKKSLPSDVRLAGEYNHAWGTEYNGFLLFEADNTNSFLDWWSSFKDKIRWYVDQTHTIVARDNPEHFDELLISSLFCNDFLVKRKKRMNKSDGRKRVIPLLNLQNTVY